MLYGAEVWVLTEAEEAKVTATYDELLRKVSRHQRKRRILDRGFDKENAFKLRKELGLPSCKQTIEKKRVCFAGTALVRVPNKKVCRVMEEEEVDGGAWTTLLETDFEKYGITSKEHLKSLRVGNQLKQHIETAFKEQDDVYLASLQDVQPVMFNQLMDQN